MVKKIIIGIVVLGVLFAVWFFLVKMNKKKATKLITEMNLQGTKDLTKENDKFLIDWAKAVKKGKDTFVSGGKTFSVKGGI